TSTCHALTTFLGRTYSRHSASLSGPVLQSIGLELAIGLRGLLLVHFKSYSVSLTGALAVSKDITKYIELLRSWDLPPGGVFEPSFEVLTEVANLFVLSPEALRERFRKLGQVGTGGWERGELRPFVLRREDGGSVGVQAALGAL
ncbi:Exocyst complex component 5, partial [Teratosphaeriaceae sp. CCFEE 6253]